MTLHVYFVVTPQLLLLDFAGAAETFEMAARLGAKFQAHYVAATPTVEGALGLSLGPFEPLPEALPPGSLVLLSGVIDPEKDYRVPEAKTTIAWLRRVFQPESHRLAAICSGAVLAGEARVLDGRRCTTHHTLLSTLRESAKAAEVVDDCVFVVDGPVMTSAGVSAGIDLSLHVVEELFGPGVAQGVARELVVWRRRTENDPQMSPWLQFRNHVHPAVHRVQDVIGRAPAKPLSLDALSRHARTSVRHLTRLFREHTGVSIAHYQQGLRVALARQLLADAGNSIEKVAELCGFQSARSLRRAFLKVEGGTPSGYRRRGKA